MDRGGDQGRGLSAVPMGSFIRWGCRGMVILFRALVFATVFVGFVLVFLPARVLAWAGVARPDAVGVPQILGIAIAAGGAALTVWCVLTFALVGKGTPAPFDPPRRLVVTGPYRFVRNPMYIGAGIAMTGAALFYESMALLAFVAAFALVTHLFVVRYEEPTLRRTFGAEYERYCWQARRWRPGGRRKA